MSFSTRMLAAIAATFFATTAAQADGHISSLLSNFSIGGFSTGDIVVNGSPTTAIIAAKDGFNDGRSEGKPLGTTDGPSLGLDGGLSEGVNDGNPDGVPDGTPDGTPDGVSLGMLDGTSLGPDVGPSGGLGGGSVDCAPLGTTDGPRAIHHRDVRRSMYVGKKQGNFVWDPSLVQIPSCMHLSPFQPWHC